MPSKITLLQRIRALRADKRGVAAVEFALILPFMLVLYIGTAELTSGLMVNRKVTLAARALADLTAQTSAATGVTDTDIDTIFAAAQTIMSPHSATPLRMAISSVEFVASTTTPVTYTARTKWTVVHSSGGTARPCGATALTKVVNSTKPSSTTMPEGLYQAGTVIVADVSYQYSPAFSGATLAWNSTTGSLNLTQTSYMRPRTQTEIAYNTSATIAGRTKCTYT